MDKNRVKMTENIKYSKSSYKLTRKRQHNEIWQKIYLGNSHKNKPKKTID